MYSWGLLPMSGKKYAGTDPSIQEPDLYIGLLALRDPNLDR
jgi:hypothetical protein